MVAVAVVPQLEQESAEVVLLDWCIHFDFDSFVGLGVVAETGVAVGIGLAVAEHVGAVFAKTGTYIAEAFVGAERYFAENYFAETCFVEVFADVKMHVVEVHFGEWIAQMGAHLK